MEGINDLDKSHFNRVMKTSPAGANGRELEVREQRRQIEISLLRCFTEKRSREEIRGLRKSLR